MEAVYSAGAHSTVARAQIECRQYRESRIVLYVAQEVDAAAVVGAAAAGPAHATAAPVTYTVGVGSGTRRAAQLQASGAGHLPDTATVGVAAHAGFGPGTSEVMAGGAAAGVAARGQTMSQIGTGRGQAVEMVVVCV
jgi:hypothetical protein